MKLRKIVTRETGAVLFRGQYPSLAACAGAAIDRGVILDDADFSHTVLLNASFDDSRLRGAGFRGANLTGANMSEADMENADLREAALYNACLCHSRLMNADFTGALFGATDIAGSDISGARFSTPSALHLNFRDAKAMQNCVFEDSAGRSAAFSLPPLVVQGWDFPLALLDRHLLLDNALISLSSVLTAARANVPVRPLSGHRRAAFLYRERDLIARLVAASGRSGFAQEARDAA